MQDVVLSETGLAAPSITHHKENTSQNSGHLKYLLVATVVYQLCVQHIEESAKYAVREQRVLSCPQRCI
jgi:hypothetical protein